MKLAWLIAVFPLTVQAFSPLFQSHSRVTTAQARNKMEALRDAFTNIRQNQATSTTSLDSTAAEAVTENGEDNINNSNTKNTIKSVVSSKLFACMVAFAVGLRVGVKRQATTSVTGQARQFPLVSLIVALTVVREVYRIIPDWAKVTRKKKKSSTAAENDDDDMSSLASISFKLQSLFNVASKKLTSDMAPANMRASLLAVFQLFSRVKEQQASQRDEAYQEAGTLVSNTALQNMDTWFEFADWAYDEYVDEEEEATCLEERLATCNYDLLRHEKTALPGRVAHYVAVSPTERTVLIAVKGTSNFEDLLTDCCGLSKPYTLDAPFVSNGSTEICAHEGIYISSRKLADDLEAFVKYVVLPNGYNILITGHSLGAGAAAMVGMLLRSRFPELQGDSRLQVVAFASPPILDRDSALACKSFTTTIINNADVIPRSSLHNLAILLEFMKVVNTKLEQEGKMPDSFKNLAAFMKFLSEGKDGVMLMGADEIKQAMKDCVEKLDVSDPDFLFVPGRVVHMFDLWSKQDYAQAEEEVEKEADDTHTVDSEVESNVKTAEQVYEGDGTSPVLKIIEVDERMVLDHLAPGYRDSIRSLLSSV